MTFMLLIPCHVHKQKLNEKKIEHPFHICEFFSFESGFFKKNQIIMPLNKFDEWHTLSKFDKIINTNGI